MSNPIPDMVDPLGKHWHQPSRDEFLADETHAVMTRSTFDRLHAYDQSFPTGMYVGKMWSRTHNGVSLLCWYDVDPGSTHLRVPSLRILFVDEATR